MADIFREVDEEVRRDKAAEAWAKWQTPLLVVAACIVLATAGWKIYDNQRKAEAQKSGAMFEAATALSHADKPDEAVKALEDLAKTGTSGYQTLARLRLAGEMSVKDPAGAIKAFDILAQDSRLAPLLQDAARLRAGMLVADSEDTTGLAARLEPLAQTGKPFRHSAREMLALAALKKDDFDSAGRWLDMIVTDQSAPAALRQRAEAFLGLVKGGTKAPEPAVPKAPTP